MHKIKQSFGQQMSYIADDSDSKLNNFLWGEDGQSIP